MPQDIKDRGLLKRLDQRAIIIKGNVEFQGPLFQDGRGIGIEVKALYDRSAGKMRAGSDGAKVYATDECEINVLVNQVEGPGVIRQIFRPYIYRKS